MTTASARPFALIALAALASTFAPVATAAPEADSGGLIARFLTSAPGAGGTTPGPFAATEAPGQNVVPFFAFFDAARTQQVFAADSFGSPGAPLTITAVAFRPDGPSGFPFDIHVGATTVALSTTPRGPDGLSLDFGANIGADAVTVYNGDLTLTSAFTGPDGGPKDFDVVITFATPFVYDPAAGNLLLDIRTTASGEVAFLDAVNVRGDYTSRVLEIGASGAVPEPGSIALVGLGGLIVAAAGFRAKGRRA